MTTIDVDFLHERLVATIRGIPKIVRGSPRTPSSESSRTKGGTDPSAPRASLRQVNTGIRPSCPLDRTPFNAFSLF